MSMGLSIYSQKGFREVTLPEQGQTELQILVQKEIFGLREDIRMDLEKAEDNSGKKANWILKSPGGVILLSGNSHVVRELLLTEEHQVFTVKSDGSSVTVVAFSQASAFSVYRKYRLAGMQKVSVGKKADNEIIYQNNFVSGNHCSITIRNGRATLHDDNSTNGTFLNFRRVNGSAELHCGDSIRIMRLNIIYLGDMLAINECDGLSVGNLSQVQGNEINKLARKGAATGRGRVLYHRSPRDLHKIHTTPFEIEAPPNPQEVQERSMIAQIGPSLTMSIPMMLGSAVSIISSRSNGTSSGAFMYMGIITAVSSALIGSMWALINIHNAAKQRKKAENRRFESYSEYLIRMRDRIAQAYNQNVAALKERYFSAEECCALDERSPLLWNRNDTYDDFLSVRLGMGDIPFQAGITIPKERFTMIHDSLADKPRVIQENFRMLRDVPVTVNLLSHRLVGIVGGKSRASAIAVAKSMIAQISTSNCYTEVKIALVYDGENDIDRNAWDYAMWLPHVWSGDKKIRYIATSKAEMSDVFHALIQILRRRSEEKEKAKLRPRFVLFVADPSLLDGEEISRYIFDRKADLGLSTVLLTGRQDGLPNECECIIENDDRFRGIYDTREGREFGTKLLLDQVSDGNLERLSKSLGRIEVIEADEEGEIPNSLTFFDMFGVSRPEELNAAKRWKDSKIVESMQALIGFRNGNTPCYLDVHEKFHGPHGLVAGTTGSGKSETLQTYILSLALNFSPEDVGFFIIDYKGGGMANLFDDLPHMIGSISNLSGNQVRRAMVSIQSENRRRQRIFTEYGVNNINGYTTLYKNHEARDPIPHLFIIIDEFAELKREQSEFMKELISVAQVGRSLGVHLILSTQRPSGTVDENIWANSKFHLCLRVQDRQDSKEMLHRDDAAFLTQAGRCYLQVGNDELFELFQSGYSGASYDKELGGGSLLIAQMLRATGKVEQAGNRAKNKRREELRRKWILKLLDTLREIEKETGISPFESGFSFAGSPKFRQEFYRFIQESGVEFEKSVSNDARIQDFCDVCQSAKNSATLEPEWVIQTAAAMKKRLPEVKSKTQLEVTIHYLSEVAKKLGIQEIPKLWLPVLPETLYMESLSEFQANSYHNGQWPPKPRRFQLSAVIGKADDPTNQAQFPVSLDFANGGHHMLTGTVGTGKSTFLQTVIYSLVSRYTPDLLNIYCLDFSAKMLSVFSNLKHVGGYVDESDTETDRIGKLFTLISRILDERKAKYVGTSFTDAMNHNGWTDPAILIVIDNFGSFHEKTGETYDSIMARIAKEGNGSGIFLLVSAAEIDRTELPSRLASNFRTGVSLEMPDAFKYADVLRELRPSVLPESGVKGRGLMRYGDRILEFQTALAAPGLEVLEKSENEETDEDEADRNELLKAYVRELNRAYRGKSARPIPSIPEKPVWTEFSALPGYEDALAKQTLLPIGYDFEQADVYSLDLLRNHTYLVTGTRQSGKSVFMENLMLTCARRGDEVVILDISLNAKPDDKDPLRTPYVGGERFKRVARELGIKQYTNGQELGDWLTCFNEQLQKRSPIKQACKDRNASREEIFQEALKSRRIDIFVGNLRTLILELHDKESPAKKGEATFDWLCAKGDGYNIFLFAKIDDEDQGRLLGYPSLAAMREHRSGIRFGGHYSDKTQKLLPFANVRMQDQDRSEKPGIGVIPSENREDPQIRVVVPKS